MSLSLVNEPVADAAIPKKTVVDIETNERPIFTGIVRN